MPVLYIMKGRDMNFSVKGPELQMELPYNSRYSFNYFYLPLCKINNLYVYPFLLAIVSCLHVFVENKISVKMLPA